VVVVAALNVVSNIALTVVEKKRDLGVFMAMGAAPPSLQRVYLTLGAAIGVIGTTAGLALGIALSLIADRYEIVPLPSDVYLLTHVPFAVHPAEVAAVGVFSFATAMLAAVMPARAAARLAPGEAIRLSR
jgi:lipoprotein-releasing system permease protein